MSGTNIQRLLNATGSSDSEKLSASRTAWHDGYLALAALAVTLDKTADEVERGFSDGVSADEQGVAKRGRAAFESLRDEVVIPRRDQLQGAATVLLTAAQKLRAAENIRGDMPDSPGTPPQKPSSYGAADDIDEVRAHRAYDTARKAHEDDVAAYGAADERARLRLQALDEAYAEASAVLAEIHGEPVYPEDIPPPGENTPGGFPTGPRGPIAPPPGPGNVGGPIGVPHPVPDVIDPPDHEQPPPPQLPIPDVDPPGVGPVGGTITGPTPGGGGGGGGLPPGLAVGAGGAVGAGLLGGPGVVNAVRNALGGRNPFASTGQPIGASQRTGAAGTLGRPGVAGVGSPVQRGGAGGRGVASPGSGGRSAGGRGAGGRGGAAGAGGAGGRGRNGSAAGGGGRGSGGAAGIAPTRGRGSKSRDDERREDGSMFDDGADWIDDEGAAPGVLD